MQTGVASTACLSHPFVISLRPRRLWFVYCAAGVDSADNFDAVRATDLPCFLLSLPPIGTLVDTRTAAPITRANFTTEPWPGGAGPAAGVPYYRAECGTPPTQPAALGFVPPPDYESPERDSSVRFTYAITDGQYLSAEGSIVLWVNGSNDAPVPSPVSAVAYAGRPEVIDLSAASSDPDPCVPSAAGLPTKHECIPCVRACVTARSCVHRSDRSVHGGVILRSLPTLGTLR